MASSLEVPVRLEVDDTFTVSADDIIKMVNAGVEVSRSTSWIGTTPHVMWTFAKQSDDGNDKGAPISADDDLAYLQGRKRG